MSEDKEDGTLAVAKATPALPWWSEHALVNGVFKGGGARGVAYAGALRAAAELGYWFSAVAGASAGAITAALIAAGLDPRPPGEEESDFERASHEGLSKVQRRLGQVVVGRRDTVYDSAALYKWLAAELAKRVSSAADGAPVSFKDLEIDLYVVTMDLHSKAPVIFCRELTPDVDVAAAVAASCAIPGFLPSGRARMRPRGEDLAGINQMVDGGAWANFPVFVFEDRLFRSWLEDHQMLQPNHDRATRTLGFVLDDDLVRVPPDVHGLRTPPARQVGELDRGSAGSSGSTPLYVLSQFIGGNPGRFAVVLGMASWLGMTLWAYPSASRALTAFAVDRFLILWPLATVVVSAGILLVAVLAGSVVAGVAVVGRAASKTAIPAATASLGVATGTPPWIGAEVEGFATIRVPASEVKTLDFKLDDGKRRTVLIHALWAVGERLLSLGERALDDDRWPFERITAWENVVKEWPPRVAAPASDATRRADGPPGCGMWSPRWRWLRESLPRWCSPRGCSRRVTPTRTGPIRRRSASRWALPSCASSW